MVSRRMQQEMSELKSKKIEGFDQLKIDDENMLQWEGLVLPSSAPYNKGAFKVTILFPESYPFKPPQILFQTKIYHPNVDENGNICLGIINGENWKPATRVTQVIEELVSLVNKPEPEHPLREDLAKQYLQDLAKFKKMAEDFTKKHAEKRPPPHK